MNDIDREIRTLTYEISEKEKEIHKLESHLAQIKFSMNRQKDRLVRLERQKKFNADKRRASLL